MAAYNDKNAIHRALWSLNIHRGRGNIVTVSSNEFIRVPFKMRPETIKYRIKGNRVYALGSSRRIEPNK